MIINNLCTDSDPLVHTGKYKVVCKNPIKSAVSKMLSLAPTSTPHSKSPRYLLFLILKLD